MKEIVLFIVLFCLALQNTAQEAKKTTVHITKVENINGVSKFTDTTYTTDDPYVFINDMGADYGDKNVTMIVTENLTGNDNNGEKTGSICKTIVFTDSANGKSAHTVTNIDGALSPEMLKALEETKGNGYRFESRDGVHTRAFVMNNGPGGQKMKRVFIRKSVRVTDASEAETKRLKKEAGPTNGKLTLGEIRFYPNPSNGKFNLSFTTPGKGDAEITILSADGKKVYAEQLPSFNGQYDKEIDLSENPKGIYFVRIKQGNHSQMKKLIIQ